MNRESRLRGGMSCSLCSRLKSLLTRVLLYSFLSKLKKDGLIGAKAMASRRSNLSKMKVILKGMKSKMTSLVDQYRLLRATVDIMAVQVRRWFCMSISYSILRFDRSKKTREQV